MRNASTHGLRIHELQRRRRRITVPCALTMNYVGSLLKTLGARSRLEATLVALRDGVVSLDLD
jgi:hypothetical protein